ncbi:MAG: quinone-dependent dihydroorotate dehydrogenase [Neisseriaceae bacterium]|nr:quinone-dependent dihydroorotate dehydrogenase [Neisseriaceae bacterium]
MYAFLQKFLFSMDAERAHYAGLKSLQLAHRLGWNYFAPKAPSMPCRLMGLDLPNPVGLAAGLDKNGEYIQALAGLGFGFIEVGTVTPKPQDGNPQPRLFRVPLHQAVVNRMGFNNAGIDALLHHVKKANYSGVLGINIGKNATTPIENAVDDYLICLEKAFQVASYITINISSPNTQNLRNLQQKDELTQLLGTLKKRQLELADQHQRYVPIAVKIAPDLDEKQIQSIAKIVRHVEMDGVIATNTTIDKAVLGDHPLSQENGGLSGKPLKEPANRVLRILSRHLNPAGSKPIDIIGVGGIFSGQDAAEKIQLGATAVQMYTGLVYQGPKLIHEAISKIKEINFQAT